MSYISYNQLVKEYNARTTLKDFKDHTDPKYIGPGLWHRIHQTAIQATTHDKQMSFIVEMKDICRTFPCLECRNHCAEYIKNHPFEEYLNMMVDVNSQKLLLGMFLWSWRFHNTVNLRLKKPIMNWDTAYNLYNNSESLVCNKHCAQTSQISDDFENKHDDNIYPSVARDNYNQNFS